MKDIREKLQSLRLFLSAHPDNTEGSEMADRLQDVEQLEKYFKELKVYHLFGALYGGGVRSAGYYFSKEAAEKAEGIFKHNQQSKFPKWIIQTILD